MIKNNYYEYKKKAKFNFDDNSTIIKVSKENILINRIEK